MKKKKIIAWILVFVVTLTSFLPSMTNQVHADPNPTPPSPPNLTAFVDTEDSRHLIMGSGGWPPENWIHEWRLSSNPNMTNIVQGDHTDGIVNMYSMSLGSFIGEILYLAVRYVYFMNSSIGSGWSQVYSVEIDNSGDIINVEPYDPEGGGYTGHVCDWEPYTIQEPTCTEPGLRGYKCKHCGTIGNTTEVIPITHDMQYVKTLSEATCTTSRIYLYRCSLCGHEEEVLGTEAFGHDFVWSLQPEDHERYNCIEGGYVRKICDNCGVKSDWQYQEPYQGGHPWNENVFITTVEPTCTTKGEGYYPCFLCPARYNKEISMLDHQYESKITKQPTCTEEGEKCEACVHEGCGHIKEGSTESIDALGHQYERKVIKLPTCTEEGETGDVCSREGCMHIRDGSEESTPALGHEWERVVKKAPTTSETGLYVNRCTRCNEEEFGSEEDIPQLGMTECKHEWEAIVIRLPSCTEKGLNRSYCKICGFVSPNSPYQTPATGHSLVEKIERIASCTQTGISVISCENLGCTFEIISIDPKEDHSWIRQINRQSTCTEAGLSVEVCSECGQERPNSEKPLELAEHQYERTTILEPKCLEYGKSIMKCTVCGDEDQNTLEQIDPPGHSWEDRITQEPTCTEKGWTRKYCTVCEAEGDEGLVDALGHDIVDDGDKDPTCTEWGWIRGHCSRCDYTQQLDLEPHGHDWEDVKTIREPNCKDAGVKLVRCRICNEEKEEAIPTNDVHDLVEEVSVEPTCTEWGKYRVYCKRCGFETVKGDKPPKGHTEVPVQDEVFNCMDGGWVGVTKCSVCGETVNVGTYHAATGRHSWGTEEIIEAPACNKLGKAQSFCTVCGEERIRELPPEDHTWDLVVLYPASCLAEGREQWQCLVCGRTGRTETIPKNEEHRWVTREGREPSCSVPGYTESISCDICGATQKRHEPIPTTPHHEVIIHSMRPTSTLEGRTEGIRCGVCGTWIVECKTLPKLAPERQENNVTEQPLGWAKGSDESASFKSDAAIDDFSHVAVNGEMVDESNYDLREGSTIVIFKPEYLETLPEGEHKVEIVSIASSAFGILEITTKEALQAKVAALEKEANSKYFFFSTLIVLSVAVLFFLFRKKLVVGLEN